MCFDEPKEICEQNPSQLTKYVDEKHCEDITTTSCKPFMKDCCNEFLERVFRQEANEVYMDMPSGEDMFREMWGYIVTGHKTKLFTEDKPSMRNNIATTVGGNVTDHSNQER